MTSINYTDDNRTGDGYAKITAVKLDGITNFEINRGNVPIDYKYNIYNYENERTPNVRKTIRKIRNVW